MYYRRALQSIFFLGSEQNRLLHRTVNPAPRAYGVRVPGYPPDSDKLYCMQDFNFFKTYYPTARFIEKKSIPKLLCGIQQQQNLLVELGCGWGYNLQLFTALGWQGKIIAYDLCQRFDKPDVPGVTVISGDVIQTLEPPNEEIDILYIDLDQQPDATRHALRQLSHKINNSWVYIDEFLGRNKNSLAYCDAKTFSCWLLEVYYDFNIYAYSGNGALIKLGQGFTADHLLTSLDDYCGSTRAVP